MFATILVGLLVAGGIVLAVSKIIRDKKKGKTCHCSGDCGTCGGCH